MNRNQKTLIYAMTGLGAVLLELRLLLYMVAVDEKNLLKSGHWAGLLIWAVAAVGLGIALVAALRSEERKKLYVSGSVAALGDGLFAAAICLCVLAMGKPGTLVEIVGMVLGWLSVPALVWTAVCQVKGKPVFFGCFCVVCGFLALYLVGIYQTWSATPQLQDYFFSMAALVGATLFAYQNAALAEGIGSYRIWFASGLLTIAFGLAAVCGGKPVLLYLGAAVWALTGLLSRRQMEET